MDLIPIPSLKGEGKLLRAIILSMRKKKFRIPRKKINKKANTDLQIPLDELHAQIRVELAGRTLPDPAEMLYIAREERDKQLLESLHLWHR